MIPETRYAKTEDGVHVAYHVFGDGPVDVLWIHTMQGGLEILWEQERIRLRRLTVGWRTERTP